MGGVSKTWVSGLKQRMEMPNLMGSSMLTITRVDKAKLKVNGATTVKMSDHGIKPPAFDVLGVGLMKTEDAVKITFEWTPEVEKK